jgi:hypothetical protein
MTSNGGCMRATIYVAIALVAFILQPASVYAQFEGAVWDTLTADTLMDGLSQQALATTTWQLHLTYAKERGDGLGWNIHYRCLDLLAGWQTDRVVESSFPSFKPVIAARRINDVSKIAILFYANDDIYGTVISDPYEPFEVINVTNSPEGDIFPSVAIDDTGLVQAAWIIYVQGQFKIAYSYENADSPTVKIIWDSQLGEFGSGAMPFITTVGGAPHIFYRGIAGAYRIHHAYRQPPDTTWTIEYLYTPNPDDYTSSAVTDSLGNIHLAISGTEGWGLPGHVYYLRRDHATGIWSAPMLVTGAYSAVNGSLALRNDGTVWIASCGVTGNFYNGSIYLSNNANGSFQTQLQATYTSINQPVLTMISGQLGALVGDSPIAGELSRNIEIVYHGPEQTSVEPGPQLPSRTALLGSYPNPFNPATTIVYNLASQEQVTLDIYNLIGQRVATLIDGGEQAGEHKTVWDATAFPSGIYFARLRTADKAESIKLVLLK